MTAIVSLGILALGSIEVRANVQAYTVAGVEAPVPLDTGPEVPVGGELPAPAAEATPADAELRPRRSGPVDVLPVVAEVALPRDLSGLAAAVQQAIGYSGASVGVTLVELGGVDPLSWSVNSGQAFTAASTYKLPVLMMLAEYIATGRSDPNGAVCFRADDYEPGWFDDYSEGACLSRNELAGRVGRYSGNTAAHMLVRDLGGSAALNAWAASHGTTGSAFYEGNTTTSADLAALWLSEVQGKLGGAPAQAWLYPLLTSTRSEHGIPRGVPEGVVVVHKTGTIDQIDNDAGLVTSGPSGAYLLVVLTDRLGGADGWRLIAAISATVWQFEASRTPPAA